MAEDADLVEGAEGLGVCTHPDIVRHDFFGGVKTQPREVKPSVKRIMGDATGAPGDGGVSGGVVQLERGRFAIRGHATVFGLGDCADVVGDDLVGVGGFGSKEG